MRLDQELVKRGLCESRTEAQELIYEGSVFVDNLVCLKQIKKVNDDNKIEVTSRRQFVSRGGNKLQGVLRDIFSNDEEVGSFCGAKIALDVGSSTGGFTDCLLSYGVGHVDAVDVGTSQLHERVRFNSKVSVFENTDIRKFYSKKHYEIIVADLSFISLGSIFNDLIKFGSNGTNYFLLIKPQFEVGRGNTKKGIVKDQNLVNDALFKYENLAKESGLINVKILPCVISGGDGNQEYFLCGELYL